MTQKELYLKYPKIFDLSFTHRVNWGIPKTWVPLVDSLCQELQEFYDTKQIEQGKCVQVKEKFGTLRFYTHVSLDGEDEIISKYERKSMEICQECGCTDCNIIKTKSWVTYLCKPCTIKLNKEYETTNI